MTAIVASPTCAVVICAYTEDRWDDTCAAVASVQQQQPPPQELIVVVDHNPALAARFVGHLPGVRVVANRHEPGVSGARNTGAELAAADVVVFLDDDATAQPGWLATLASRYAEPDVLGVGGRIDAAWDTARPPWFPAEFDWVVGCSYTGQRPGPVRNLIGANASFRRELFADGGFVTGFGRSSDAALPLGCEETEFCIRVVRTRPNGVFIHDDAAVVRHRVPPTRETFSYFLSRCYSEGLSKAQVTQAAGVTTGLSAERSYSTVTLPRGVVRNLGQALRGDLGGLSRAAVIVMGLAWTTAGYVRGVVSGRPAGRSRMPR